MLLLLIVYPLLFLVLHFPNLYGDCSECDLFIIITFPLMYFPSSVFHFLHFTLKLDGLLSFCFLMSPRRASKLLVALLFPPLSFLIHLVRIVSVIHTDLLPVHKSNLTTSRCQLAEIFIFIGFEKMKNSNFCCGEKIEDM